MKLKVQILLILIHISGYIFSQGMNFKWEKTIGTSGNNVGKSIIYDNNGYLYVAGEFHEDFILDNATISGKGNNNIFIVKLDLEGNLIWSKSLGGNFAILGQICFDVNMDIVCTGTFSGALILKDTIISSNGGTDIFIMKIKNTGKILSVFSDGGIGNESSHSLCIDKNNDLFVCGNLNGTSTFGNQSVTSSGYWQYTPWGTSVYLYEDSGFFVKYNSQNKCIFAKLICKNRSALFSIVSDTDNNIYTSGFFASYSNITDTIASKIGNFLVFKYDQDGKFINLIQEGSDNNFILVKALAIDKENNLLVTGSIECSGCIFGDSLLPSGSKDAFLAKYDHRGNLKWINLLGQDHDADGNANSGNSIVIDSDNNVLIQVNLII